jgi:hypothetical protein
VRSCATFVVVKIIWRRVLWSVQVAAAVAFATACDRIVDPALPSTANEFAAPLVYTKWWSMVESCSGVSRPLANVTWFGIPGSLFQLGDQVVTGYWTAASNRIVLADSARLDGSVVRHEMLHALIRANGHPRSAFLEKCAGLVSCTPECVTDAGPYTGLNGGYAKVPPDSLDLSIEILPNPPTFAVDAGVFSMVVVVHNRASYPVNVILPTINGQPVPVFAYEIRGLGTPSPRIAGIFDLLDQSATTFAAGETKRHYFDFNIGTNVRNRTVVPAGYRFTGTYAGRSVTLSPIVIAPP